MINEKILGLPKNIVLLSPYRDEWPKLFEEEKKLLAEAVGGHVIDIQHVGSTSVPGLISKPIIDIAIAINSLEEGEKCIEPLIYIGYEHRLDVVTGGSVHHFFSKGGDKNRTHHIHMEEFNGKLWYNHILFRDYIRTHDNIRDEYAKVKIELAEKFSNDRKKYQSEKDKFVEYLMELAKKELSE